MKKLSVLVTALVMLSVLVGVSAASTPAPQSLTEWHATDGEFPQVQPVAPGPQGPAPEALTFYSDRPTFDADFPGLPVEGYENANVLPTDILGFGMPLDEFTNNGIFSPGDILPGISFWASGGDPGSELVILGGATGFGETSKTVLANFFVEYYIVRFDPPVQAAGMDLQTLLGSYSCNLDIYGASGLLGSTTSACNEPGVFWGVASDGELITEVHITDPGGGAEGADNVAFGSVAAEPTMHVHQINMLPFDHPTFGPLALGLVRIWDEFGMAVAGATVYSDWTIGPAGPFPQARPTNASGIAIHYVPRNWPVTYQLCVTDVTAAGFVYDPNQNLETCDSLTP